MTVGGWLTGRAESSLLRAYVESSGCAFTSTAGTTGLSNQSNSNCKACHRDTLLSVRLSKPTRAADMVRALSSSLSAVCSSVVRRMRSYCEHPKRLQVPSSRTVPEEDQQHRRRSSSYCQRRQYPQRQHQQKRRECEAGAKVPTCVDCAVGPKWCWTAWMPALCAGIVAVLCYMNSLDGDFVHDDMVAVVGNPDVTGDSRPQASSSSSSLWINDFWGRPMADPRSHKSYRPLTVLSFRANYYANGRQVRGYHIVNVALHCACSVLVAIVARRVMRITALHACLAATLFAAHPVHTEAVSSIVGRAEVLCCLFFLLSFLCYHSYQSSSDGEGRHGRTKWLATCGILSVCALLSKEQGITVLPLCMALRIHTLVVDCARPELQTPLHKAHRRRWPVYSHCIRDVVYRFISDSDVIVLASLTTLLLCFRLWILQGSFPEFSEMDNPASFSSMRTTRLLTYSYLCAFNAWLVLCPRTLSYDWQMGSIPLVTSPLDTRNLATLAIFASLLALAWRALTPSNTKRSNADGAREQFCYYNNVERPGEPSWGLLVPLLLTALPFLPASNLFVTVGFVVAERVLYIPSIGVTLLVAEGLHRLHTRCSPALRWCTTSLCFILVLLFAARTWNRNAAWASREALFESGIRDLPGNAKMHYNYANLQKDIGNTDLAIKHYRLAIELWPEHASAHNNLGTVLTSAEESEQHFRYALHVNPSHPGAHFNLANIYSKRGQKEVAKTLLERAVELEPDFCEAYSSLAALAAEKGDLTEAERLHRMALSSDDRNADARNNYGTFLQSHGRSEEAVAQYQQALHLQQNHTVALLNAARSLRSMNLNMQAESLYKRALAVEPDPQVMDNLALFYVNAGRLDEARQLFEEIDRLFPENRDNKVHHAQLLIRLRSFRAAEDLLLDVIEHNSTDRGALHTAALLYNHINRTVEALDYILKALKLCGVDDVLCARIHSDHGDILKDLGDITSSAQSYEVAIRLDPDLAHAHLNLAVIRHLESDYPTAFRHYQTALSLDPKNKLILDNMAKLRRRMTRPFHDCV
ncbi:protein O-mannosyl-transferase TMTC1-like [Rhipicephalus sanguineus]|uniref:protein O-mannosyl-transferase TMTC1-like n=1 Tax=Rhipicephalus sanguineus TaxID=34632 RepID=UPI001893E9E0|nr:protein O-mannosyl-transferase TMTC1-like [Rhipicephalus sanguineus]